MTKQGKLDLRKDEREISISKCFNDKEKLSRERYRDMIYRWKTVLKRKMIYEHMVALLDVQYYERWIKNRSLKNRKPRRVFIAIFTSILLIYVLR